MTNLNKAPSARIDEMEKTARDGSKSARRALLWGAILGGLKMTDEVRGLPDDVRLFRAQAAIRAKEGETPCSFKTEHVYNTCTKCGADDVKGCQNPKGGKDDQACDP